MSVEAPSEPLEFLAAYQPIWSSIRQRRERTLVTTRYGTRSGNPQVEYEWLIHERQMNDLLEEYFTEQLGAVALDGIEHEQIIAEMAAGDGRGSQ